MTWVPVCIGGQVLQIPDLDADPSTELHPIEQALIDSAEQLLLTLRDRDRAAAGWPDTLR